MDLIAKLVTVSGLCLDIVGASFLAYEFLIYVETPGHRPENYKKEQLDSVRRTRDSLIAIYKDIQPPLSREGLQKHLAEINDKYGQMESRIETVRNCALGKARVEVVDWWFCHASNRSDIVVAALSTRSLTNEHGPTQHVLVVDCPPEWLTWAFWTAEKSAAFRNLCLSIAGVVSLFFLVWRAISADRSSKAALTQAPAALGQIEIATKQIEIASKQ